MEVRDPKRGSTTRVSIAVAIVLLIVAAVWKLVDYRTQPPPPPNPVAPASTP